jgi:hypothetical protein
MAAVPPPRPLVAWCLLTVLAGAYVLLGGPNFMPDSAAYSHWADRLIDERFDFPALVREAGSAVSLSYALFVTLVAVLKLLFGAAWPWALVLLGAAATAAVGALLSRLTFRLTGSGIAAWAALALYAGSFDLLQWTPRVGSDSTFLLFAFAVFLMEVRRILSPGGRWLPVFAASAAASFYRPTGVVLFPITAWSFYLARTGAAGRKRARTLGLLAAGGAIAALALAFLWRDPTLWPFAFAEQEIAGIARGYGEGQVVWDRRETYHAPPAGLAGYWTITADRLLHFFAPGAADYSLAHWLVQACFYLPVYLLSGWFVLLLLRGRTALGPRESDACYAALGAILAYALFHAIVQIDYDWRYRTPIMPHLILLAAGGVAELVRRRRPPEMRRR